MARRLRDVLTSDYLERNELPGNEPSNEDVDAKRVDIYTQVASQSRRTEGRKASHFEFRRMSSFGEEKNVPRIPELCTDRTNAN